MKRDMELIRKICFAVEELEQPTDATELQIDGFETDAVVYHCEIMIEAGLLFGQDSRVRSHDDFLLFRLTWAGHEFVDSVRNNNLWAKVSGKVKTSWNTISFEA
ncbi:MAG: DUF2513 domain-containing protein [Pirellulaceae bacterium]|nr:DUF2513 domain-containing protein [Pirellulaceae bacterium]